MTGAMPLNMLTNVDPALPNAFIAAGGTDPRINPRRRAGIARPPLTILAESDFITPNEYKQDAHYQEFAVPWDVPYICLTTLERRQDLLVGLAAIRSKRQGHIDAQGRRAFATIAPHVRAAVRTSLALAEHGEALSRIRSRALTIPAFICDQRRRRAAAHARSRNARRECARLHAEAGQADGAQTPSKRAALSDAIAATAAERRPEMRRGHRVVVHSRRRRRRGAARARRHLLAEVDVSTFAFDARVLVLVRGSRRRRQAAQGRHPAIGVRHDPAAETEIALQLFAGKTPETIAREREVSSARCARRSRRCSRRRASSGRSNSSRDSASSDLATLSSDVNPIRVKRVHARTNLYVSIAFAASLQRVRHHNRVPEDLIARASEQRFSLPVSLSSQIGTLAAPHIQNWECGAKGRSLPCAHCRRGDRRLSWNSIDTIPRRRIR